VKHLKRWFVLLWMLVPVALLSYHFGPGQRALAWQDAHAERNAARAAEKEGHWEQAVEAYSRAINAVPSFADDAASEQLARDQLRLAQIRAAFQLGKLDESVEDLRMFVEHVAATHGNESSLMFDARDLLGRMHFQAMVALRLEAAEKPVWMKQWELSRQNFRFLAEHSTPGRNALDRKNLEAVIKSADLPVIAFAAPAGGGGGGAATAANPFAAPPTQGNGTQPPPPDNRSLRPTDSISELTPPEFELGS
jgi:hypothetical protein